MTFNTLERSEVFRGIFVFVFVCFFFIIVTFFLGGGGLGGRFVRYRLTNFPVNEDRCGLIKLVVIGDNYII